VCLVIALAPRNLTVIMFFRHFFKKFISYSFDLFCFNDAGYRQHDAQEFVSFLLDGLHEDLNNRLPASKRGACPPPPLLVLSLPSSLLYTPFFAFASFFVYFCIFSLFLHLLCAFCPFMVFFISIVIFSFYFIHSLVCLSPSFRSFIIFLDFGSSHSFALHLCFFFLVALMDSHPVFISSTFCILTLMDSHPVFISSTFCILTSISPAPFCLLFSCVFFVCSLSLFFRLLCLLSLSQRNSSSSTGSAVPIRARVGRCQLDVSS
jgi:hypothetical protein